MEAIQKSFKATTQANVAIKRIISLRANGIWDRIAPHVDNNDFFLLIGVTTEHQGWLPQGAWDWINSRQSKMAA